MADIRVKKDYDHDLGHDYDNGFDLDHLQDIIIANGHDGDECFRSMSSLF